LSLCYHFGFGVKKNYPAAIELYEKSIELGSTRAMCARASIHKWGKGGEVDYQSAIALYEKSIELGSTRAMCDRASMHIKGQGGEVDYQSAIALYEKAIELGDKTAMNNRAYMYEEGLGGKVDYANAIVLYEKAIELGGTLAMNNRAYMYEKGQGGKVDYPRAIALYERAVAKGHDSARRNLSYMHRKNLGYNKNDATNLFFVILNDLLDGVQFSKKTITLLKKHCNEELSSLLVNLHDMPRGLGVDLPGEAEYQRGIQALDNHNLREAKRYFENACAKNHPSALVSLFELYIGLGDNQVKAAHYKNKITPEVFSKLRIRSKSSSAQETYILSLCYRYGHGNRAKNKSTSL